MSRALKVKLFLIDNLIWVVVLSFFLINAAVTPRFSSYENIVNIFYHSAIMSMLVLGQGMIMMIGRLDLSLESTLVIAPGIAMLAATRWIPGGLDPLVAIGLTLGVGAAVGWFNGLCVARIGVNHFLQTLSVMIFLRGMAYFMLPFAVFPLPAVYSWLGRARTVGNVPVAVVVMVITFIVTHLVMRSTAFGRYFMATGGNPRASFIAGIDTSRMLMWAFVMGGVLAAIAGLFTAGRVDSVGSTMGEGYVLLSFAGAILGGASLSGGKGTPIGMLGGALLLGMFSNALNLRGVEVTLVYAIKGALIFVAIVLDREKERLRNYLLHQEQVRRLLAETATVA